MGARVRGGEGVTRTGSLRGEELLLVINTLNPQDHPCESVLSAMRASDRGGRL